MPYNTIAGAARSLREKESTAANGIHLDPAWLDQFSAFPLLSQAYIQPAHHNTGLSSVARSPIQDSDGGLLITEYVEGSSFNKALELTNTSDQNLSLEGYSLELYSNGNTEPSNVMTLDNLGTLAAGDSLTIAHPRASSELLSLSDTTSNVVNFNGNDAVALLDANHQVTDMVGTLGSADYFGQDTTLRRDTSIHTGSTTYDPDQWEAFPIDSFSDLGSFNDDDATAPTDPGDDTDPQDVTLISTIQGEHPTSALQGERVTVEAIVTQAAQDGLGGFFIQEEDSDWDDNDATSEGIFVYAPDASEVHEGDKVHLSATVDDYQGKSELTQVDDLSILDSGQPLPSMTTVELPVYDTDSLYAWEGMRVAFEGADGEPLTVTDTYELGRYGSVTLSSGGRILQYTEEHDPSQSGYQEWLDESSARTIVLDDASNEQNPDHIIFGRNGEELSADNTLRGGDTLEQATGVLDFAHDEWRIQSTRGEDFEASNPREAAPDSDALGDASLKIASFNVLNYFNTLDTNGASTTTPQGTQHDPRGADNSEEFLHQQAKIVSAINASDADVVGLMEIENNGYGEDSAIANLVNALNEDEPQAEWHYVTPRDDDGNVVAAGDDAISVGMIYKSTAVSPEGNAAVDTSDAFSYGNRPPLAQTFSDNDSGETFSVVVNHLKSKGSVLDGQADIGDGQGNNNGVRVDAAEQLADWLASDPTHSGDSDYLLMGDFNSYAHEDPITSLENDGFQLLDHDYSYGYDGAWGSLDHALASSSMEQQVTGTTTWHINADEPASLDYNTEFKSDQQQDNLYADTPYRASDHDPVIVGINPGSEHSELVA